MLELKHISFDVQDGDAGREIIRDVSLTIPDGRLVVVTGPAASPRWRGSSWASRSPRPARFF